MSHESRVTSPADIETTVLFIAGIIDGQVNPEMDKVAEAERKSKLWDETTAPSTDSYSTGLRFGKALVHTLGMLKEAGMSEEEIKGLFV